MQPLRFPPFPAARGHSSARPGPIIVRPGLLGGAGEPSDAAAHVPEGKGRPAQADTGSEAVPDETERAEPKAEEVSKGSARRKEDTAAVEANWPFPEKNPLGSARRANGGPKPSEVESFSTSPATYVADDSGAPVTDEWWPGDPA